MTTSERVIEKLDSLVADADNIQKLSAMKWSDQDALDHRAVAWIEPCSTT
jgi:hypothetical protein